MPRGWSQVSFDNGLGTIQLSSWRSFSDYVNQELLDYTTYIYRGQGYSSWELESTIDRVVRFPKSPKRATHLRKFQLAVRGRRGPNPPDFDDENEWWALGQNHGLLTPLLDWTESPFVALFFAMVNARSEKGTNCCVWALSEDTAFIKSLEIQSDETIEPIEGRKPIVEIIRPMSDENSRLVSQRGLFTRSPNNVDIEEWIKEHYEGENVMQLIKIVIPKKEVVKCLRYLNRMNINHATLFPDISGASHFCNMELQIKDY